MVLYGLWQAIKYRLGFGRAFVYEIIGAMLWFFIEAAGYWVILSRFGAIGGWSFDEVFLLFAVTGVVYGIGSGLFWRGNEAIGWAINTGFIDLLLTKPVNFYASFIAGNISPAHLPNIFLSIALMVWCITRLPAPVSALRMALFVVGIVGGMLICAAINTVTGALGFRAVRGEFSIRLISSFSQLVSYPMHIFPRALQAAVTFVVPFALTNYYPTRYLIRGDVPGGHFLMPGILVLGCLLFIGAYWLWTRGMEHYQSTGS